MEDPSSMQGCPGCTTKIGIDPLSAVHHIMLCPNLWILDYVLTAAKLKWYWQKGQSSFRGSDHIIAWRSSCTWWARCPSMARVSVHGQGSIRGQGVCPWTRCPPWMGHPPTLVIDQFKCTLFQHVEHEYNMGGFCFLAAEECCRTEIRRGWSCHTLVISANPV